MHNDCDHVRASWRDGAFAMLQSKNRILFHCGDLGGVETTDFDSGFFGSLQSETWLYFVG